MNTMSSIGKPINQGRIFFRLKDKKDRVNQHERDGRHPGTSSEDGADSRPQCVLQIPPTIRIGGSLTKSQYQYTMQSPDTAQLYQVRPSWKLRLRSSAASGCHQRPAGAATRSSRSKSITTRRTHLD